VHPDAKGQLHRLIDMTGTVGIFRNPGEESQCARSPSWVTAVTQQSPQSVPTFSSNASCATPLGCPWYPGDVKVVVDSFSLGQGWVSRGRCLPSPALHIRQAR
jgi:hypothetical protein